MSARRALAEPIDEFEPVVATGAARRGAVEVSDDQLLGLGSTQLRSAGCTNGSRL